MTSSKYNHEATQELHKGIKDSLVRIESQVKITNGRVSALEMWKYIMVGGMSVLSLIVIPILGWTLWTIVNIQSQIQIAVTNALSAYDIK